MPGWISEQIEQWWEIFAECHQCHVRSAQHQQLQRNLSPVSDYRKQGPLPNHQPSLTPITDQTSLQPAKISEQHEWKLGITVHWGACSMMYHVVCDGLGNNNLNPLDFNSSSLH